ncbi:MAG: Fe-S cluster assembly protein SufD [Gemmataceae bacterium]|nr:Fe-S cluster assembly protein SufD [Gemmataceae bacterium]
MVLEAKTNFLRQFEVVDRAWPVPTLAPYRQQGRARFAALAFPTPRTEDWRFTNVAPLLETPFELPVDSASTVRLPLPPVADAGAVRLVFVNGAFDRERSEVDTSTGLVVESLATAGVERLAQLDQVADSSSQVFTALNTSLLCDGAVVRIPDGAAITPVIEVVWLSHASVRNVTTQPRLLVVAGAHSRATIVERFWGTTTEPATYFTNAVAEIAVGEHAVIDHYKVQQEAAAAYHVANTQVVVGRGANFTTHAVLLGGRLVRNEVRVRFAGEHAEATVNGLYVGAGKQHIDNHTVIDHAVPHCASHELYKGILTDQAHGVFNGKIFVRQDAQKTDAKQTNQTLLLSDDGATINTKPQLEIFADDVKCTHGATVGQLDADQLFYLQSRGLAAAQARRLLTFAFANDIVHRIHVPAVREELEALLVHRNLGS